MARSLDRIIVLGALAALVACIEVAPRSSVPFHTARDRHARYLAEVTLAIKEERRDALSEAAANGRVVLPQTPEIWGIAQPQAQELPPPDPAVALDALAAEPRRRPLKPRPGRCGGSPVGCAPPDLQLAGLAPGLLFSAAIMPAAAPPTADPGMAASPYRFQLHFGLNSAAIDAAAERVLERAVGRALMIRPVRVIVAAHADRSGADAYNQRLSQRRAAAVVSALIRAGVPPELIETAALGERAPAVWTEDGVPLRHNRRVEIALV